MEARDQRRDEQEVDEEGIHPAAGDQVERAVISATSWRPNSQATPARPNHYSVCAITTSESHCVGSQSAVAKVLTEPGCRNDQWCRNSEPKRRWK